MVFQVVQIDLLLLKVHRINGNYIYWLINLTNDGHSIKYDKNDIFGQDGQWVSNKIKHFVKLDKQKWHLTYLHNIQVG